MSIVRLDLIRGYLDWFKRAEPQFAFTGSARQGLTLLTGAPQMATVSDLAKNTARVMERVSRDIYGRKAVRHGARLRYCGCVEGNPQAGKRLHVHIAVAGATLPVDPDDLSFALAERWRESRWGFREVWGVPIEPGEGEGWYKYMLKEFDMHNTERWFANY